MAGKTLSSKEEDEPAGDLTEESETTWEDCEQEGSVLQEKNMKNIQKEYAQMEWVGRMNNIRSRAVEIVNAELICS